MHHGFDRGGCPVLACLILDGSVIYNLTFSVTLSVSYTWFAASTDGRQDVWGIPGPRPGAPPPSLQPRLWSWKWQGDGRSRILVKLGQ